MANTERYVTIVELNSQQAQDRLKELEKKVRDLKKAKEDAARSGSFFDEKELKKTTRELNQWRSQITGVKAVLENIEDQTLEGLNKALRKLKLQSKNALPGTDEWNEAQRGIMVIEDRIKQLKNATREAREESARLRDNLGNLSAVMSNIKGASLNQLTSAQHYLEEQMAGMSPKGTDYSIAAAQLKEVKNRIQEIKAEQQQIVHQIDRYDQEIKTASKDMATVERETKLVNRTLANLSTANVRDLEYSIKIINEQLRETPRGTRAFDQMQEKAKALRTELERVRFEGQAQQSLFNRTADFFNKIQGAAIAAVGAVTGLTFTVRRCVESFAEMDQEMENVRKYTGMTSEQVHGMNEEFKKLDTRTARERLNQLAGDAGRLGITSQEAVLEFVDAADKINVALGDDLGDEAVKSIGKLAMSFGEDEKMGLRGAMLATGSAVNELAQNSSAAANYLVDFTARVAGFGKQVGLSQAQIMGFAAVMDENMLQDEMAATAFGQLLVKMTTNIDTFAKITGMKAAEFKKLVTEDINGAVLAVAKSLQGRDMEDLGKVFDAMNLNGQRAIGVLATLGQKVDDVQERQRIANDAYREGTSIINEFNVQNETVQADLEKAKKRFHDLTVELGEKLMPIARYGISTGALMVKGLSAIINVVSKAKGTIILLTTTIAALTAIRMADTLQAKAQVFWNEKVIATCKRLWAVVAANPWTAAAVAMMAVVGVLIDFFRQGEKAVQIEDRLTSARKKAAAQADEERMKLEVLIRASKDETLSLSQRMAAIEKLNQIIPGYCTELDKETGKYKENKKALDDYLKSLTKKYEIEGAKDILAGIGKDLAELNIKVKDAEKAVEGARDLQKNNKANSAADLAFVNSNVQQANKDLDKANKDLQKKLEERKKILDIYGNDIALSDADTSDGSSSSGDGTTNTKPTFTDPKKEETATRKRAAQQAKELRERNNALKAETEKEIAILTSRYAQGEIDYRTYQEELTKIQINGINSRMAIYEQESDDYKKLLNDREQLALKAQEQQERMSLRDLERQHNSVTAGIESSYYDKSSGNYLNAGAVDEALFQADIEYLQKKKELYRVGSEERAQMEEQIEDMEAQHKLERQRRYEEMLLQVKEQYLQSGNEEQMRIAINGLDELHKKGLVSEEEYQKALLAIRAKFSSVQSDDEQTVKSGKEAHSVASDKAKSDLGKSAYIPFFGAIQQYKDTFKNLEEMYKNDEISYETYQEGKRQATLEFLDKMASDFQVAYNQINQIMSAASSLFSAQQDYELAILKKKYDKEIEAAGGNQKKVKKLQEKQAKEEAEIKSKYNARAVKIQIAQAIASTALSAINAYSSAAQVPLIGFTLAPIAAAAAIAAGAIQIAAIKKQAQAQEAGYYEGGYTGGKQYRRRAGVVHEGEFVANHQAVENPNVRPMLDFIDSAQRNNTIGRLSAEDVSRQLGGGNAVVAPVVNVQTDNEELRSSLDRSSEVNERLLDVIENEGVNISFPMDSFHKEYSKYQKLYKR
ncbi:MAG: phage tail tape measure protein [Prevotella sp.]|nr:phage tail tape measure protein [Prevotella sp.]